MERQHLVSRRPRGELSAVVARIGGLHGQVLSSAELAAWARVEGLRPGDLESELWERRSLVKTWAMRGTFHLLPAAEYGLSQAALDTFDHYRKGAWLRGFKITHEELDLLLDAVRDVLVGSTPARTGDPLPAGTGRGGGRGGRGGRVGRTHLSAERSDGTRAGKRWASQRPRSLRGGWLEMSRPWSRADGCSFVPLNQARREEDAASHAAQNYTPQSYCDHRRFSAVQAMKRREADYSIVLDPRNARRWRRWVRGSVQRKRTGVMWLEVRAEPIRAKPSRRLGATVDSGDTFRLERVDRVARVTGLAPVKALSVLATGGEYSVRGRAG